jgi:hypothetical protein
MFSPSTFTVEINGTPAVAFQTKWHAEADEVGRGWAISHPDEHSNDPSGRLAMPPMIKVRLASAVEKAAYEAATNDSEFYGEVKMVKLPDLSERQAENGATVPVENVSDNGATE